MDILYVESEHGKEIADGIDSAVKRVVNAIIAGNVNEAVRYVLLITSWNGYLRKRQLHWKRKLRKSRISWKLKPIFDQKM